MKNNGDALLEILKKRSVGHCLRRISQNRGGCVDVRTFYKASRLLFILSTVLFFVPAMVGARQTGVLSGRLVNSDGTPVKKAVVLFFDVASGPPPAPGGYWRIPETGAPTAANGRFAVSLPQGDYYIGAIRKPQGSGSFPTADEWLFLSLNDTGTARVHSVTGGEENVLGTLVAQSDIQKRHNIQKSIALLTGIIRNSKGMPMSDLLVEAYSRQGSRWPLFSSQRSGKDGRYKMQAAVGSYQLKVRRANAGEESEPNPFLKFMDGSMEKKQELRGDSTVNILIQ